MRSLSLPEWANVAEIIGTVVVIASLAYVGMEVNQNTQAVQLASYQSMNGLLIELDVAQASNGDLNRVMTIAETSPTEVTPEEWIRFVRMAFPRYGMWEYLYLSKQRDAVDENQWLAFEPYYRNEYACKAGYIRFWEEHQEGFAPPFVEYMQSSVIPTCKRHET